ncbi:MAG: hypothetical protein K1X83_07510 [Oligoflexia bacterium]|nr:hypothetical protein [Oligoflexia bacterium]
MNTTFTRYDAFIIDSDIDTRMRLRQATSSVQQFGKVTALNEPRDATMKLQSGAEHCDVIFLSCRFDDKEIAEFVRAAKETKFGQDAAYILVLNTNNQDSSTVANSVMLGLDGFLFEPYSVDQLVEITVLSAKVKKERSVARERIALTLMMTDMMNQLDLVAYLKSTGILPETSWKKLTEFAAPLRNLGPESFALYCDIAVAMFSNAPAPKRSFKTENYKGASSRVKRKMEQKLIAETEKQSEEQKAQLKTAPGSAK